MVFQLNNDKFIENCSYYVTGSVKWGLIADNYSIYLESCKLTWYYFETWSYYTSNIALLFGLAQCEGDSFKT